MTKAHRVDAHYPVIPRKTRSVADGGSNVWVQSLPHDPPSSAFGLVRDDKDKVR